MNLQEYYKRSIYDLGYHYGQRDAKIKNSINHSDPTKDIYFNDEADYDICMAYYGEHVGDESGWTQEDIDYLEVLGFATGDFLEY